MGTNVTQTTLIVTDWTEDLFNEWLRNAAPGARVEYYQGHMAFDREGTVVIGTQNAHVYREPLHSLADAVWSAYRKGKVSLTQRRVDQNYYHYFATKRRRQS